MRIIKEMPSIYITYKYMEPGSKLGIFISELKSRINKEKDFINHISSIKYWDFYKVSLWSFEEVLNYIDELLEKYSLNSNEEINNNILKPLIKFILLLMKNCYNKEIFASFDNLQKIYLTCFDIEIKTLIIEINLILVENKHSLVIVNKLFYRTFHMLINLRMILIDLINNNFVLNQGQLNFLEQLIKKIYKKWSIKLKKRKLRLTQEENELFINISPFDLFKEIIDNKKDYKNINNFKQKEEYEYFTEGYITKTQIYENNLQYENGIKYLLKDEIIYIICMNNFFFIVNEIVQCGLNNGDNKEKINLISKYILSGLNLYIKDNQINYEEENSIISENYIQNYYNDVLSIITSQKISLDLKTIFLTCGTYFMVTFDGYDNILFKNGLFHSFLNDLTHQNGKEKEVLTIEQKDEQEFLNIILNFVFNFKIFKEIPQHLLSKILEVPNNKIYPYRIDNIVFALKKRKVFDEKIIKNIILPRLTYELDNLEIPSEELKYGFNKDYTITINQRNNLIDKLFRVLVKIVKKNSDLNPFGNFDKILEDTFKKIIVNKSIIEDIKYIPSIINFIYFFIKLCNCFPSKIPLYINNNIFDLIITYFQNNFPKCDGAFHLIFLLLYTISIHNDGKTYLKNNIEKIRTLFDNIFNKIMNNENYFYYNLFVLRDLNKYELYSPYNAFIHTEGISEIIKIIFDYLKIFIEKIKSEINNPKIKRSKNIIPDEKLYFVEAKRSFIDEYFISFSEKDIDLFENNLKIEIIPILKSYLDIILSTNSLYSLSSHFVIIKPIIALAIKYPEYVMDKLYDKIKEVMTNNFLDIEEIQFSKIIFTLQKIFEEVFKKIYQKTNNNDFINNLDKYTLLSAKFTLKMIELKKNLTSYISPINDRQLIVNNKYYAKFISKKIDTQFRNLLITISYKILYKFAPHTINPKLLIMNEDNYKDITCPIESNKKINLEILSNSFFFMELLNNENKFNNYLLTSVDYLYSLGKISKSKALNKINIQDISRIKNYIKLSYLLSSIIKNYGEINDIKSDSDTDDNIKNILFYLSLFNYINILIYGKMEKNISSIVIFYFIKFGGIRHLFKISKKFLYYCKYVLNKKELPITELLIIKNFWNIQVSLLLLFIKYSFYSHNNIYTIMILEHNLVKDFSSLKELDAYIKYLILNDFIEIFFDKNDYNINIEVIKDIEIYSPELSRLMYVLFDSCIRTYNKIRDMTKEKINLKELFNKGYNIYEIVQVIQEGQINNENIIKIINEYRNNENDITDIKKENKEKEKEHKDNSDNSNLLDINTKKMSQENINNDINDDDIIINRSINRGINDNGRDNENKEKKMINKFLHDLENVELKKEDAFIKGINDLFLDNKEINKDINNNIYYYTKENFLKKLNYIYEILDKCSISNEKINDMKKMNIKYRIKTFEEKKDLLPYLEEIMNIIKKLEENNKDNKEEILMKELSYIKFMNYSILRYKTLTNFYENEDINKYTNFIHKNNLIENSANSIKDLINNKNVINIELINNLIYEHFLRVFILFCFLEYSKINFEKEKKIFLDAFLYLIKEYNNNDTIFIYNEAIIIICLQIIIQFFDNNDKSEEIFKEYLINNNLFKYLLELKFNSKDAHSNFYENNFRYFVTLEETFKQFILKIFSEKKIFSHLLESVFKYALANMNPDNNEVDLESFIELFSDYIKLDNKDIFINSIKNIFNIIQREKDAQKIFLLKIKPEYEKDIEIIKEEINNGEDNKKNKEKNIIKNNENNNNENNIIINWSENNKILFNMLLEHIYKTSIKIKEDIIKQEQYEKFSRNYLFDLDTSLCGLNCILHIYPSYINLLLKYNIDNKINFIKYLISQIFPLLNHYHYSIVWPDHVNSKDDLENNITKERKDAIRRYNNKANSFQSFFESLRNVNIIASIIHSITYKRRNMNNNELYLINQCRKNILYEIDLIFKDIDKNQNVLDEFNFVYKNDELYSNNEILFKSCIIVLYSMTEYIDNSDIFNQFNPFEISNLIISKEFNIISSISNILKNMKFEGRNAKFHEMGIRCLEQIFKYIKINNQKKEKNENINIDNNKEDDSIMNNININNEKKNNNEEEEDLLMENYEESNEMIISEESFENEEEEEINQREEEEYEDEEEIDPQNILDENNVEEEDLLSLMQNGEDEEDSNEALNNLDNPIDLNNLNMRIIQNEYDEEEEDENSDMNNLERIFIYDNDIIENEFNSEFNYNEENILFYEYYTESSSQVNNKSKSDLLKFYEEFIVFPFLILRIRSKNNLIYFNRQKINIDIFSNISKVLVEKAKSMFLYYYLFPFDLKYNKYFDFILIGLKNKTIKEYYTEINNILNDLMSTFSTNNEKQIKELCDDICNNLKEDASIIKEEKEKENLKDIKEKESNLSENNKDEIKIKEKEKNDINLKENKEKKEEPNIISDNNNLQFIFDLPPDLRDEILSDLDPSIVDTLSPELRAEYDKAIFNRNLSLYPMDTGMVFPRINSIPLKIICKLRKLNYKKKDLFNIFNNNIKNISEDNKENNLVEIFDDNFLENIILYNIKKIIIFKGKEKKKLNEYETFLNKLINSEILRYKIIDIFINLWLCDSSFLFNLLISNKLNEDIHTNSFLDKLYSLYIKIGLTEDLFFNTYENFFTNFAMKYQKYMKKYFLETFFNEKGEYISMNKIFNITQNSKNLKQLMNIEYKKNENVLSNLLNLTLGNNSYFKTSYSIKIFTVIIQNCLKNDTNKNYNELNISIETIEKIFDLFNNFEVIYNLNKDQRSNNPTSLLIEMINDKKIFQKILDILPKRILFLKENITKEIDDFVTNKMFELSLFNKLLPDVVLFKLVKFISSLNDYFNNEQKSENKLEMYKTLKHFIKNINEILFSCWKQLNNILLNINTSLKDNQENLFPKLNRLIPYLETFITLSHLQFISTNSPLNLDNNPFIFEKKFESNIQPQIQISSSNFQSLSLIRLNSKNEVDSFVEFFYEFCENNKKIINFILRQYPRMFTNELIKKISSLLDLDNKRKYFRHSLRKLPANKRYFQIIVRRGAHLLSDSFEALYKRKAEDLRGKLIVSFENEEAIDAGGVKREWLTLLSKEMFNPNYMLFTLAKNGTTYTINSDSGKYNTEHLKYFEFIGKIMAKAIFDGMMIDCYFTRIIYKLISGTPISYHDMEDYDPVYYNSIKWLLENDFSKTETSLTYSYNHDDLGEIKTVDLIENGRNIEVTEANKFDYVQRLCSSKLYDTIKLQIDALLKGFYDIIPQNLISIFTYRELELVISGMPTIDIRDWKNNTIYENYTEESDVIKNFWEIIESFDNDERAEFLQFVTGSSKVPLEGFRALQGIGGINKFKISKVFDKNYERLPTAHTCTNQLDLPEYPNKEILGERLRLAIKEGKNSFGFI